MANDSSTSKASEAKDASVPEAAAGAAAGAAAAAAVDPKEKYLQLLTTSLVLVRDAVETQDQRYMLRMLRRFKQLRLQQQQYPKQLLQVCSLIFWGQPELQQQQQQQEGSSSSSSSKTQLIHRSIFTQEALSFWRTLRETLEEIVRDREGEGEMMNTDEVHTNPKP